MQQIDLYGVAQRMHFKRHSQPPLDSIAAQSQMLWKQLALLHSAHCIQRQVLALPRLALSAGHRRGSLGQPVMGWEALQSRKNHRCLQRSFCHQGLAKHPGLFGL